MGFYYAVPVRRENRALFYNPLDGQGAVASTPHDAAVRLGMPKAGSLFAVWPLIREASLEEAGAACSIMAPARIYIMVDPEKGVFFPLDPMTDAVMEVPDAGRD